MRAYLIRRRSRSLTPREKERSRYFRRDSANQCAFLENIHANPGSKNVGLHLRTYQMFIPANLPGTFHDHDLRKMNKRAPWFDSRGAANRQELGKTKNGSVRAYAARERRFFKLRSFLGSRRRMLCEKKHDHV
jgi:hypothetical protein